MLGDFGWVAILWSVVLFMLKRIRGEYVESIAAVRFLLLCSSGRPGALARQCMDLADASPVHHGGRPMERPCQLCIAARTRCKHTKGVYAFTACERLAQ